MREIFEIGEMPPIGELPAQMYAQVIRPERFGEPTRAFQVERVAVPEIAADEVLVYVMAAGINYNNVWAALGVPIDIVAFHERDGDTSGFHIGGSDASGIVFKVGSSVTGINVGDQVVVHAGCWSADCPLVKSGTDPMFSPTFRLWGYETNWGSFAQFARVQAHQCLTKPRDLSWEAAAAYMLVGATAWRMLMGWPPHTVSSDEVVLVWGGAGGLGCQAIQIARAQGGIPIAVVSSEERAEFCRELGAKGCIDRRRFNHWGPPPNWKDKAAYGAWLKETRNFGKAIWDALGEKRNPRIVFEHPGEATVPTSIFVCDAGGMVVICAGTTGYNAVADLRYLWMRQKRFQGSHLNNDGQAKAINDLVSRGAIDPCLSRTFSFDRLPEAHQLMHENRHPPGNMACLVGSPKPGLKGLP